MAAARLKQWAWPTAAALAVVFLAALAFHGERPEAGLARFAPAGPLAAWTAEQVTAVTVTAGIRHYSFFRGPEGAWCENSSEQRISGDMAERIETGLKLLRNSPPQRSDLETGNLAEFGLARPHLTVTSRMADGVTVTIEFGRKNPLGLEHYARVAGRDEVMLLPTFVAESWEPIAAAR